MKNMKIAYIGYDPSAYLAQQELAKLTDHVHFFLIHPDKDNHFKTFLETDIFTNHVMIPALAEKRTEEQKRQFELIKKNYYTLYSWICGSKPVEKSNVLKNEILNQPAKKGLPNNFPTTNASEIVDIKVDERQKKCFIEVKKKGLEEYDLVLVEDHNLVAQFFLEKNIKYFHKLSNQKSTWVGFQFKIDFITPKVPLPQPFEFLMVQQSSVDSVMDNFYLIKINSVDFTIWQWLPTHQLDNPQFDKFIIERTRSAVSAKLSYLVFMEQEPIKIKTTVSCEGHLKNYLDDLLFSVPNFSFWQSEQVEDYLKQRLDKKVKDYKKEVERKAREAERLKQKTNREINS